MPQLPVDDYLTVKEKHVFFEGEDWMKAAAVLEGENDPGPHIAVYLWRRDDGDWKVRHKLKINEVSDWVEMRDAIDGLVEDAFAVSPA